MESSDEKVPSPSSSPRNKALKKLSQRVDRIEEATNTKQSQTSKPRSFIDGSTNFQRMLERTDVYNKIFKIEKVCQNLIHDVDLMKANKFKNLEELVDNMNDYRTTKYDILKKLDLIEANMKKMGNKMRISIGAITEHVNITTQDFLKDFQNLKHENNGILREFKRSAQEYRSFISEVEKSPNGFSFFGQLQPHTRNKNSKSLNKISYRTKRSQRK